MITLDILPKTCYPFAIVSIKESTMVDMKAIYKEHTRQKANCKHRVDKLGNPVKMNMTKHEFADVWIQSGKWHLRGRKKGQYCMARNNDIGHYEVGNVKIVPIEENTSEAHKGIPKSAETIAKMSKPKIKTQCPHCGMFVSANNMKRWHGDNCKRKGAL